MPKMNRYHKDSHGDEPIGPPQSRSKINVGTSSPDEDFNRQYDLTPLGSKKFKRKDADRLKQPKNTKKTSSPANQSYSIDPWEVTSLPAKDRISSSEFEENKIYFASSHSSDSDSIKRYKDERLSNEDHSEDLHEEVNTLHKSSFIMPSDIHPRMEEREDDIAQLRLLAGKLNADWGAVDFMAPALARRIRDFQFAQEKRRKKYGHEKPWGILGLYDHLTAIRVDIEWAEDAAWRRANGQPYLSWADFDASKKKGANRPFFTYFLLFTCTIALIVSIALNGWKVEQLDINPMIGPSAETLILMGAKDSHLIVYENEVWRVLSSAILHAGFVHYVINCLALWFVGKAIETTHGTVATAIIFIISAIGGTLLSAIFLPEYITVGASGGIFGLIGACLSDIIMNWKHLFSDFVTENGRRNNHLLVVVFLILDILLNCLIGLTPYVDNFTHLGGMMYGLLCGLSTMERLSDAFFGMEEDCFTRVRQIVTRFLGLIISIILIITTTVILLQGDGETAPCPNCMWLSCVPFPPWNSQGDKWWYCDDCGRVSAEIIESPSLHLQLDCPGGTSVAVGLETEQVNRDEIEDDLPGYCRDFCPNVDKRF